MPFIKVYIIALGLILVCAIVKFSIFFLISTHQLLDPFPVPTFFIQK